MPGPRRRASSDGRRTGGGLDQAFAWREGRAAAGGAAAFADIPAGTATTAAASWHRAPSACGASGVRAARRDGQGHRHRPARPAPQVLNGHRTVRTLQKSAVAAGISAQGLIGFPRDNMALRGPWPYLLFFALDGAAGVCAVLLMRAALPAPKPRSRPAWRCGAWSPCRPPSTGRTPRPTRPPGRHSR
jgi:hypothetical protein